MPKGKPYPAEFKAKVVLEAMRGTETINEVAARYDPSPSLVRNWKAKAESELSRAFSAVEDEREREREHAEHREEVDDTCRKIGELAAERDHPRRSLLRRFGIDIAEDVPRRPGKRSRRRQ